MRAPSTEHCGRKRSRSPIALEGRYLICVSCEFAQIEIVT